MWPLPARTCLLNTRADASPPHKQVVRNTQPVGVCLRPVHPCWLPLPSGFSLCQFEPTRWSGPVKQVAGILSISPIITRPGNNLGRELYVCGKPDSPHLLSPHLEQGDLVTARGRNTKHRCFSSWLANRIVLASLTRPAAGTPILLYHQSPKVAPLSQDLLSEQVLTECSKGLCLRH